MEQIPAPTKPFLHTTLAAKMAKALIVAYMANVLLLYGVIFTIGFFYETMPRFAAGILAIVMINRFRRTERETLSLVANPSEATVYNSLIVNKIL